MKCYIKDYPRPQFVRKQWENLNGQWDFTFDDQNVGEKEKWFLRFEPSHKIQVPFTYETKLSGIQDETAHNRVWYHRTFEIKNPTERVFLHLEGSDYETKVWVNGQMAGSHRGGYSRISFDITELLVEGSNDLTVKVTDSFDETQPRGKQRWRDYNFGCWYVQTTGIWKTVWLEYVPVNYIENVKMTPNLKENAIDLEWNIIADNYSNSLMLKAEVSFEGQFINSVMLPVTKKYLTSRIDLFSLQTGEWGLKTWTPWYPALYDITFTLWDKDSCIDTVGSYFGLREISIKDGRVLLNGAPIYQKLILDQGYWRDSHLTPPSEEALIEDIKKIKEFGYNGARKHQKLEDERFLYWCDVMGLLVWSEAPATYEYNDVMVSNFIKEWVDIVRQNYNHPSIITWTPVNESWGVPNIKRDKMQQSFTEAIYHITKSMDRMRPVIVNDGWEHTVSDIITIHDYQESGDAFYEKFTTKKDLIFSNKETTNGGWYLFAEGYEYQGQPVIISEYGGIAYDNSGEGWGYGYKVATEEDLIKRFDSITTAIKKLPYVCGYCYTQITDVQQEVNGLLTLDRELKVDPGKIKEINDKRFGY